MLRHSETFNKEEEHFYRPKSMELQLHVEMVGNLNGYHSIDQLRAAPNTLQMVKKTTKLKTTHSQSAAVYVKYLGNSTKDERRTYP